MSDKSEHEEVRIGLKPCYGALTVEMEFECCPACGIVFAVPARYMAMIESGRSRRNYYFCPNGHRVVRADPPQQDELRDQMVEYLRKPLDYQRDLKDGEKRLIKLKHEIEQAEAELSARRGEQSEGK